MGLKVGEQAPDFTLRATGNKTLSLSKDLKGQALILYFYPKDFTPGCTLEACEFRDSFEFFASSKVPVFGISKDSVETHERFIKKFNLPYDLLSDPNGLISKKYGAIVPFLGMGKRITYLLDEDHVIRASYDHLFNAKQHIQEMIGRLKRSASA